MIDFEKTIHITMLLDFYGVLLTDKQQAYMQYYFNENLSLQEIANVYEVSRNAIYDSIQRTIKQLDQYEKKLLLFEKFTNRQAIINHIKKEYASNLELTKLINELEELD